MRTTSNHARRPGFTLIEILVVVIIIGVLMAITVAMGQFLIHSANRKSTEVTLEQLGASTDRYMLERGRWPWQEWSGMWEIELTRRREPSGGIRAPYFDADPPTLRRRSIVDNQILFFESSQAYIAVFDAWSNYTNEGRNTAWAEVNTPGVLWAVSGTATLHRGIRVNTDTSVLGRANQGMPVYQSAGRDGNFTGFGNQAATYENSDDVFSHCGSEK